MRKKDPEQRFKTTTISLNPELFEAFTSKVERDRTTRSEVISSLIQSWLSGEPVTLPTGDPSPTPVIDIDQITREITDRVLRSLPQIPGRPEPKPEQSQLMITPPEPGDRHQEPVKPVTVTDQGEEPLRPVFESKNGKVSIEIIRDYLAYHTKKYMAETGKIPADIAREAPVNKNIMTCILTPGSANQKNMKEADFYALEALVLPRGAV